MIKFKQNPKVWFKKLCFFLNFSPVDIHNFFFARGGSKKTRHFFSFRDINWSKTKAFSFTNNGQILINLKGRQPQGCVKPGKEYDDVCNEIVRRLSEIKDPDTGEKVMDKVYRKEQIYSGKYLFSLSDIFWLSPKGRYTNSGGNKFYSKKLIENCSAQDVSGAHDLDGIALFYGNGVIPGKRIEGLQIQDIAPLILAMLGIDIPKDMDGKVKGGLFNPNFLKGIKYSNAEQEKDRGSFQYSQEEAVAIEKRLKELGYID